MRVSGAKPKLTEAAFTRMVLDLAKLHGYRVAHFRPARTESGWRTAMSGDIGFPDLVLAKKNRPVIFAELKTDGGKLRPEQAAWMLALEGTGAVSVVLRPRDWNEIVELLSA